MERAEGAALPLGPGVAKWTLIASILGSSMAFVDGSVVNVALPSIQGDLGGGLATQQWVVDAYLLTLGSLILVGGSLGDIFGESRVFAIGVASFAGASLLCAIAPDAPALIVFRGLQGMAGALLTPASLAMITATFTGAARGNAIGQWTSWTGISFILGPTLGGWLVDVSSWRVIFLINIPIALATFLLLVRLGGMHQKRRENMRVDVVGAVLCTAGLGLLVAGFIEQPQRGWGDPLILAAFVAGAALLGAFVVYELRTPLPMLPLRLFRLRNFSVTNIETLSVYGGLSALTTFLTLYLIEFAGFSALHAGISLLPVTIVMFFLSPRTGRLSMQYGPRLFMALGPIVAGVAVVSYTWLPQDVNYWVDILPALLVFALGLSLTVAPLTTTVLADAGPGDAGVASGVNNAVARIAGLLAIAILGILAAGGGDHLTVHGFHVTMGAVAGLLVCGGLIGAIGIRNPART
ncbi:MAG: DHA2 family efflux MFS transporter permease subunit [Actinobacteria bacterium]|nr:MAG: DHA2 family efflux MFS transporter permease subunit [Actinomycetota bacterium]